MSHEASLQTLKSSIHLRCSSHQTFYLWHTYVAELTAILSSFCVWYQFCVVVVHKLYCIHSQRVCLPMVCKTSDIYLNKATTQLFMFPIVQCPQCRSFGHIRSPACAAAPTSLVNFCYILSDLVSMLNFNIAKQSSLCLRS
jgi:hypothetical protein